MKAALLNIFYNLLASGMFIFLLLFFLRPKIKIAPHICKQRDVFDETNRDCYLFKVVNLSWFSAYDVSVDLSYVRRYPVKDGINSRLFPLSLKVDKLNFMPSFRPKWLKRNNGDYAFLFRTYDDLNTLLQDQQKSIFLQVTLRHGLTGLAKVFTIEYVGESDIKTGTFAHGKKFNIA